MLCRVGDWVRFRRNQELIIGLVEYRKKSTCWPYRYELETTAGWVEEREVLERRGTSDKEIGEMDGEQTS